MHITGIGDVTLIGINIPGGDEDVLQAAELRRGGCTGAGPIASELGALVAGKSLTALSMTAEELRAGGFSVHVHETTATSATVACGAVAAAVSAPPAPAPPAPAPAAPPAGVAAPNTGAGPRHPRSDILPAVAVLTALAGCIAVAFGARRASASRRSR
jgi:hypothetical protein